MRTEAFDGAIRRHDTGGLHAWFRLLRFPFHLSYITVVLGAAAAQRGMTEQLLWRLCGLYLVFNIVLYGGLYTLNALTDAESDRQHPGKRQRPLAAGAIGTRAALTALGAHLCIAFLLAAWLYGPTLLELFATFTLINLVYSLIGRQIAYLEIVLNALTYPARFAMGVWLAGGRQSIEALFIVFLTATGVAATRRYVEKSLPGWEARRGLRMYSPATLSLLRATPLVVLLLMWAIDSRSPRVYYWVALPAYVILVFGLHFSNQLRRALVRLWTR